MRGNAEIIAITILILITIIIGAFLYDNVIRLVNTSKESKILIHDISLWKTDSIALLKVKISNIGNVRISSILIKIGNITLLNNCWHVIWYQVSNENGELGKELGISSITTLNYSYNWGDGIVYNNYSDRIGYIAIALVEVDMNPVNITAVTNDGIQVYIDGQRIFKDSYHVRENISTYSKIITVSNETVHSIIVKWYDWEGVATSSIYLTGMIKFATIEIDPGETITLNIPLLGDLFTLGEEYIISVIAYDEYGNTYSDIHIVECSPI